MATQKQSKHWLDQLTDRIIAWQKKTHIKTLHVDDMKTPSGRVHTGALKGVVLHDLIYKALKDKTNNKVEYTYVFNDMDPMDGLPTYLDQTKWQKYMGMPLYQIPAPSLEESGLNLELITDEEKKEFEKAKNFAQFYAIDFAHAFKTLGCEPKILFSSQLYASGKMDQAVKTALDNTDQIKQIYQEVAEYKLPENWHPYQVVCPKCGKVGTTLTTGWDGKQVAFECQPNKVDWAKGCGYKGQVAPTKTNGKLLWKVDWPAHWSVLGINVEGAGKDHTSAGGSRDMANALCQRVFKITIPFDIPYEWILIRGAKMSSSKGVGTSAREFVRLLPPELGRFLFLSKHYNQVIDFDPTTEFIPQLFDAYDQAARIYWQAETGDERLAYAFKYAQVKNQPPKPHFLPRFRDVVVWMQHPEINLEKKFAEIKGKKLTDQEKQLLAERQHYAKNWLKLFAPAKYQLTPKEIYPSIELTTEEKQFFIKVANLASDKKWQPDALQQAIYELAKDTIGTKKGFQTIYQVLLGKTHGPKAAWLLLHYPEIVKLRVKQLKKD